MFKLPSLPSSPLRRSGRQSRSEHNSPRIDYLPYPEKDTIHLCHICGFIHYDERSSKFHNRACAVIAQLRIGQPLHGQARHRFTGDTPFDKIKERREKLHTLLEYDMPAFARAQAIFVLGTFEDELRALRPLSEETLLALTPFFEHRLIVHRVRLDVDGLFILHKLPSSPRNIEYDVYDVQQPQGPLVGSRRKPVQFTGSGVRACARAFWHTLLVRSLRWSHTRLCVVPTQLNHLFYHVRSLTMTYCDLTVLPAFLTHLPSVRFLDVSHNNIDTVEDGLSLPRAKVIDMQHNMLKTLPIVECLALERLDVSFNLLSEFPSLHKTCPRLTHLYASKNFLVSFPDWVHDATQLSVAQLFHNTPPLFRPKGCTNVFV